MKTILVIFLLTVGVLVFSMALENPEYLGTADKTEFYYSNTHMKWDVGKDYCQQHNMTLASFHSPNQVMLLKNFLNVQKQGHWTAGIQPVILQSFSWDDDGTNSKILSELPFKNYFELRPVYCLAIINNSGTIYYYPRKCESTRPVFCTIKK